MKRKTILVSIITIILIMAFSIFKKKSKEEKFWDWFGKNQKRYYEQVENLEIREDLFNELSTELKKVHSSLVFEFSPIHENKVREFTISAEGVKEVFPIVLKLIDNAPKIDKWQFNAFRQRIPGNGIKLNFGNFTIGYDDIFFRYTEDNGKLGIELNIRDFEKNNGHIQNAVYILLDSLLGEYDVTMGIGWIDWVKLEEENIPKLNPLINLRTLIDQRK